MSDLLPPAPAPGGEFLFYQTEDGRTRIQCRFADETIWLSQALIAEMFQKDVRTINEHLVNIFDEDELNREATIRKFRIVRSEGRREVARDVDHYRLEAKAKAELEYERYRVLLDAQPRTVDVAFEQVVKELPASSRKKKKS